jgi:hypothetical protein
MSLPSFFSPGLACSEYAFNRDSKTRADVREYCEGLWKRYEPLNADPHFLSDAKQNFHARTWEMILTCALLDQGLPVTRPPSDGPDIKVAAHDGHPTVWIEAVTVQLGTGQDHAGRIEYQQVGQHGVLFQTQPSKTVLRYTSAIDSKRKQLEDFRGRGIVAHNDCYVIAINGALLDDYTSDAQIPEILRAVYPIGDASMQHTMGHGPVRREYGRYHRDRIAKASGTEIRTDAFVSKSASQNSSADFTGVSALLYSRTTAWNPQPCCRDFMLTIHNMDTAIPLPDGYFAFGREAFLEAEGIQWRQHRPTKLPQS